MPSLWKKNKGNKFSKLVEDLQTPPSKRGGGALVETGFPTSLVDLFNKNRDKLKKPKKPKKIKSKKSTISDNDNDSDYHNNKPSKNHLTRASSCCELDNLNGPTCSNVRNSDQNDVDNFEENIVTSDSSLENIPPLESPIMKKCNDCYNFEANIHEKKENFVVVFNSRKYVMLLSILMGALCFGIVLFAKNWFLAFITLGVLLLLLFKNCENFVWIKVSKCGLIVLVVLNTKCFVAGITIGVCLLILLECVGNSIFGFFKICQNASGKLQGILVNLSVSNKQIDLWAIPSKDFVPECRSGLISDDRDVMDLKGERNSLLVEDEKQERPFNELVAIESDDSKNLKSDCSDSVGCIEGDEDLKLVNNNVRKAKKNRKFWRKLVSRKRSNKRKKQAYEGEFCVQNSDCMQDIAPNLEEEDQGVSEGGLSTSTISRSTASLTEGDESGTEKSEGGKICITEMLQLDNKINNSCGIVKDGFENIMYFIAMVIPLIGLIGGRMLATLFTIICCLVFIMVKKLRNTSSSSSSSSPEP